MATKTNAARELEKAGIFFECIEYPVDENDLSGEHVAEVLHMPAEQVFKTLVLKGERLGYVVCCIPSSAKIDLKKTAKVCGDKAVTLIPVKELLPITGYIRGGCSPIGMKKKFSTFIDETAILHDEIIISAGIRGAMLKLAPEPLTTYLHGTYADLIIG